MTAWYITDMLQNTVSYGSGTAAALENMPVAGKTGTTTSDFDRWFAGYTPYYTGVVWCGYDTPEEAELERTLREDFGASVANDDTSAPPDGSGSSI